MALIRISSSIEDAGTTVIAIDTDKNSQFAVKWAVDNLLLANKTAYTNCTIVHVRHQSMDPHDVDGFHKEGRPPTDDELKHFFLPYRGYCARKGIEANEVIIHDLDVSSALLDYVTNNSINNLVVGASHRSAFVRRFRDADVPTSLLKSAPETCSVYVISKGKVQTSRAATCHPPPKYKTTTSNRQSPKTLDSKSNHTHEGPDIEEINRSSLGSSTSCSSDRLSFERGNEITMTMRTNNKSPTQSTDNYASRKQSTGAYSDMSETPSFQSDDFESMDSFETALENTNNSVSSQTNALEAELRRLKLELKQTMEAYNSVCREAVVAKQRANELQQVKTEKTRKLEEARISEESAIALVEIERQKTKAAIEATQMAQRLADMESHRRKVVEKRAEQEAKERKRALANKEQSNVGFNYRRYTIHDIEIATDHFNNAYKIGEGGYGPVYKGILDHTPVAIKVLRSNVSQGLRQFKQEIEVLSCIRHPHMVLLVGACPEYGCLVYEFMEHGSLEDRLFQKDNTPPIPWRARFKIAAEIATALLFLHQTKPEPLVHRDLKPANILLNRNYVSKISDVGLARLVPPSAAGSVTQYRMTVAAGTFCYIDPEYQQSGMLGVKSDVYALGIILLQIITAKPPMGLSYQVEEAIENGTFSEILDPSITEWPMEETLSFAKLALHCCQLRKKDRPDLSSVVLPELNRLLNLESDIESNNSSPVADIVQNCCSATQSQMNVNRRWPSLKSTSEGASSFKSNIQKESSFLPPKGKQDGRSNNKSLETCLSFMSCSTTPNSPLRKHNSFS